MKNTSTKISGKIKSSGYNDKDDEKTYGKLVMDAINIIMIRSNRKEKL